MKKKFLFISIFIISFFFSNLSNSEISIVASVEDEVITNHDVLLESRYLMILNPNIQKLSKDQIINLAKKSLINEIIKKKEINKIVDIDKDKISRAINKKFPRQNSYGKLRWRAGWSVLVEGELGFKKTNIKNTVTVEEHYGIAD